jgi:hypothetical protein
MAIKGKKKSQRRGAQARRRPASAPRPVVTGRGREPWYKTTTGRMVAVIVLVLAVSLGAGIFVNASSDEGLETRRNRLEQFTDQVRDLRGQITDVTTQMSQAPMSPRQEGFDELGKDARKWSQTLGQTLGVASSIEAPEALSTSGQLLAQAVRTWATAAQTFQVASTLDADAQPQVLVLAASQREQALEMWGLAVSDLEDARGDADMDPSGLQPPAAPSVAPPPGTSPPAPAPGGNNGGNKKGSKKDGKDN